jgi:hypothetical protein
MKETIIKTSLCELGDRFKKYMLQIELQKLMQTLVNQKAK